ncbi:Uncharacterized protein FWK35_00022556 [Aphis craccivora]|uniref:Uncharacterized protein n=1 Tax=Aphis craccivora TaxID=307492 RepID=A0A6G0YMC9_APHCR|nr:Uncharacterized protein FWK35_00022556 [Aphis craccivora]
MLQFQTVGVVSYSKINLVGALGRSFFEFPNSFQKRREKQKKIKEKREFSPNKVSCEFWFKFLRNLSKTRKFAKLKIQHLEIYKSSSYLAYAIKT